MDVGRTAGDQGNRFPAIASALLLLFLLGVSLPAGVAADGSDTVLYGHVYGDMRTPRPDGGGGPNPMNTLQPEGENSFGQDRLIVAAYSPDVAQLIPDTPATKDGQHCPYSGSYDLRVFHGHCDPVYGVQMNEAWFFTYGGPVTHASQHEFLAAGGLQGLDQPLVMGKDLWLDGSEPMQAQFFMSAGAAVWPEWKKGCEPVTRSCPIEELLGDQPYYDDIPWPYPDWSFGYGIQPRWIVASKVYAVSPTLVADGPLGKTPSRILGNETTDDAVLIGAGASAPFDMLSLPSAVPESSIVYAFHPDPGLPQTRLVSAGYSLWWWLDWHADLGPTQVLWPQSYALHSGEFTPPTLRLPVQNPIEVEMVMPSFSDGKIIIIALFNSPFGSYDVPLEGASLEITGPDGRLIATDGDETVVWMQKAAREQQSLLGISAEAALARGQATWLWNYLAEPDIRPGEYIVRVRVENQQGKQAEKTAFLTLDADLAGGAATASLGGVFSFSEQDIRELEECHGCHDAESGALLEGITGAAPEGAPVQSTLGETEDGRPAREAPAPAFVAILAVLVASARTRRR